MTTFTKKMIRAECRKLFGADWFKVSPKLKQARKELARQTLVVEELTKLEPVIESEPAQPLESPAKADPLPRRKGSPAPEPEPQPEPEPEPDLSDSDSDSDSDSSDSESDSSDSESDSDSSDSESEEDEEDQQQFSPLGKEILIRQGKFKGLNAVVIDWNPEKEQIRFQVPDVKHRKCWNKWNLKKFNIIEA